MASQTLKFASLLRGRVLQVRYYSASKFDIYGHSAIPELKLKYVPKFGTYPKGFLAGSTRIGIKPANKTQPDLVLVASEKVSCGAAVFTKNEFPAAPVIVSRDILRKTQGDGLRGVIINSWCANAITGKAGLDDAVAMSKEADKYIVGETGDERESSVLVMSTGVIAQRLPISNILKNVATIYDGLGNSHQHWLEAARGICTTDTFPKLISRKFTLPSSPGIEFSIAGITKGAGMIHPNMATTLGVICTDAAITPRALQKSLSMAVEKSYNCISIDGDTSTNDMIALLANGAAGGDEIDFQQTLPSLSEDFIAFKQVLTEFLVDLAKLVVRDGEGATKFVNIRVVGSPSYGVAKHIASTVARSVLVKTALYGKDANWGRVLCALGYSLIDSKYEGQGILKPELTSLSFLPNDGTDELRCLVKGEPLVIDETRASELLEQEDINILINLKDDESGSKCEEAVYWTCDLSHEFVKINGEYRS